MPIVVQCTNCQAKMKAPDGSEGRKAKCPRCGTLVTIMALGDSVEEDSPPVDSGEDAGHIASGPKKPGGRKSTPSAPTPKKSKKSDFDFVDDDEPEEEEEEKPRKKSSSGYTTSKKSSRPVRDEEEEEDRPARRKRYDDDDDDEEEEEERPRKKRRKRRRSSSSGGDSGMDGLFINGGTTAGLCIVAFCCCWPIPLILGIIGLVACNDPDAKRNALIVTIVSALSGAIGVAWAVMNPHAF